MRKVDRSPKLKHDLSRMGCLVAILLIARALAARHATPPAQHKTWASIAVLAARRARDGSGDAEVLVATGLCVAATRNAWAAQE